MEQVQNFLNDVQYNDKFQIRSGAIAQFMKGLQSMLSRVSENNETDSYKKSLYPSLRQLIQQILDKFYEILSADNDKEHDIKKYNLCGYNGRIRKDSRGRYPFISGVNPTARYGFANFGYYVRALKQRFEFIANRDAPNRYNGDVESLNVFNNLKVYSNNFVKFLNEEIEPKWKEAVDNARTNGGEIVQNNIKKRTESKLNKQKYKRQPKRPHKKFQKNKRYPGGNNRKRDTTAQYKQIPRSYQSYYARTGPN